VLVGAPATSGTFIEAAEAALADAVGRQHNAFKVGLAKRAIVDALEQLVSRAGAR
jgi:xanthine dehydrogenase YagS FAD-binding subunit